VHPVKVGGGVGRPGLVEGGAAGVAGAGGAGGATGGGPTGVPGFTVPGGNTTASSTPGAVTTGPVGVEGFAGSTEGGAVGKVRPGVATADPVDKPE